MFSYTYSSRNLHFIHDINRGHIYLELKFEENLANFQFKIINFFENV